MKKTDCSVSRPSLSVSLLAALSLALGVAGCASKNSTSAPLSDLDNNAQTTANGGAYTPSYSGSSATGKNRQAAGAGNSNGSYTASNHPSRVAVLQNPETKQTVECRVNPWGSLNFRGQVDTCIATYERAGYKVVADSARP